jgi:hypothetical protein
MLLERLTLVALFVTVALMACSDGTAPVVRSIGNQGETPEPPDTEDTGRAVRGPDDAVVRGLAPLILPRGVRFTVLRGDPATSPKTSR